MGHEGLNEKFFALSSTSAIQCFLRRRTCCTTKYM